MNKTDTLESEESKVVVNGDSRFDSNHPKSELKGRAVRGASIMVLSRTICQGVTIVSSVIRIY